MTNKSDQLILVLDAGTYMRDAVVDILEFEGWQAVGVADSQTALAETHRLRPALIVCDLTTPGVDTLSFLEALRADPETRTLPFVVLTDGNHLSYRHRLELNTDAYLQAPFTAEELVEVIKTQLGLFHPSN